MWGGGEGEQADNKGGGLDVHFVYNLSWVLKAAAQGGGGRRCSSMLFTVLSFSSLHQCALQIGGMSL